MFVLQCELEGTSPLSFSRPVTEFKKRGELPADWEARCWKQRLHKTKKGQIYIPAMAFKLALENAGRGVKIPGEGNATYTNVLKSGVMVFNDVLLDAKEDDIVCEELFVPSDGKRGGGKRVVKKFPTLEKIWKGILVVDVIHPKLNKEVLVRFLEDAGRFIGVLRWRPMNGGLYGRFKVKGYKLKN